MTGSEAILPEVPMGTAPRAQTGNVGKRRNGMLAGGAKVLSRKACRNTTRAQSGFCHNGREKPGCA
jgi:hypothetical protein